MPHAGHAAAHGAALAWMLLPALLLALYLLGAARARQAGTAWRGWRAAAFALGCALLLVALSPPAMDWAHRDLRGHMAQHLLLGMLAPIPLVLAAPGTLLLRCLPVPSARRLLRLLGTAPLRLLIHPATAALLDIGGMYLLYLTPLYARSTVDPALHAVIHLHFLVAGCLFTWSIAGPDPARHRPGRPMRLAILLLAAAAHGILAKFMYANGHPGGTAAPRAEIEAAAQWMYYGGDLAEALLAAMLLWGWLGRPRLRIEQKMNNP